MCFPSFFRSAAGRRTAACRRARACGRIRRSGAASVSPCPGLSSSAVSKARLTARKASSSALRELHAHRVDLLDADAMLAGDGAADLHAQLQDLGAEMLGAVEFAGLVGVEQDQRMQVAVAGMEHVGAAQAVLDLHVGDAQQHLRQVLARDGAVHAVVVGRDAAGGREGVLAARPELQALGLGLRHRDRGGAGLAAAPLSMRAISSSTSSGSAVGLAQQDGGGVSVVAGVDERLDHARTWSCPSFPARPG